MPTGPYTSLTHLYRDSDDVMKTAHHFICVAFNRIVDLFLENPLKTTLYYSVDAYGPPNSKRLGLGIFSGQVGEDVIKPPLHAAVDHEPDEGSPALTHPERSPPDRGLRDGVQLLEEG